MCKGSGQILTDGLVIAVEPINYHRVRCDCRGSGRLDNQNG